MAGLILKPAACQRMIYISSVGSYAWALRLKDMLPDIRDALESSTEEFAVHLEELEMTDTMTEKLFN